jgi:hypothetical protein
MRTVVLLVIIAAGCHESASSTFRVASPEADRPRAAVRQILDADQVAVRQLRANLADANDRPAMCKHVAAYLDVVDYLDTEGCPKDFTDAYRAYTAAWRIFDASLAMDGNTTEAADRIDRYWKDVLALARKYRVVQ